MSGPGKDYVLGRGMLFFDPFIPGSKTLTGERYIGNTPEVNMSGDQTTLDHFDSDNGINVKDESVTLEDNLTGSYITDNIDINNVAQAFGTDPEQVTVTAATAQVTTHTVAAKGRWVQLGVTNAFPQGARNVDNVVATIASATVTVAGNLDIDLALGRVYIEPDAPDIDLDDVITFTFDIEAGVRNVIVENGTTSRGALRYISTNPVGSKKDYYWPDVKLTLNGDMALKGDEWQQIPMAFEVLQKSSMVKRVYIDSRP